ncbi:hypothetical protein RintRC_5786 [Richelia intracellularis]|nr:hypothetical protein RintRC_5786 [Richelia intracellularis]
MKLQVISSLGFLLVLIGVGISYFVKGDNFNFHVFGKTFRYFWILIFMFLEKHLDTSGLEAND